MSDKIIAILVLVIVVIGVSILLAFPTMLLWNWLMPKIFGLIKIDFLEALGLNLLAGFLLKPTGSTNKKE